MAQQRGGLQYWRGIPVASHTGAASGCLRGETYETVANCPVEPRSSVGRAGVAGVRSGGRRPSRLDVGSIRSERRTYAGRLDMGRSRRVAGERLVAQLLPEAARRQARVAPKLRELAGPKLLVRVQRCRAALCRRVRLPSAAGVGREAAASGYKSIGKLVLITPAATRGLRRIQLLALSRFRLSKDGGIGKLRWRSRW